MTAKTEEKPNDAFKAWMARMEKKFSECEGLNWTTICREAGYSRSVPDRWKRKPPKTIVMMTEIESVIDKFITAAKAKKA